MTLKEAVQEKLFDLGITLTIPTLSDNMKDIETLNVPVNPLLSNCFKTITVKVSAGYCVHTHQAKIILDYKWTYNNGSNGRTDTFAYDSKGKWIQY